MRGKQIPLTMITTLTYQTINKSSLHTLGIMAYILGRSNTLPGLPQDLTSNLPFIPQQQPSPTALTSDLIQYASSLASTSNANPEVLLAFLRQTVGMLGGVDGERELNES